MAKGTVYAAFEVCEGFGPDSSGPVQLRTEKRAEADACAEESWRRGSCVQLYGIRPQETGSGETRVLLRSLVGLAAA